MSSGIDRLALCLFSFSDIASAKEMDGADQVIRIDRRLRLARLERDADCRLVLGMGLERFPRVINGGGLKSLCALFLHTSASPGSGRIFVASRVLN